MKTLSATIHIGAEPMAVWAILADLASYPHWNPLFREASGELVPGQRITLRSVHPASGKLMTVRPRIVVADPGAELRWASSLPPLISGEHSFVLTPEQAGTRFVQSETFRRLLVPLSGRTFARAEASFAELNQALAKRAEGS